MRCGLAGSMCCIVERSLTLALSQRERELDRGRYANLLLVPSPSGRGLG